MTTGLGSYPTLFEVHGHSPASANEGDTNVVGTVDNPAGNTPGVSSYANVTSAPSRKALNFHTLLIQEGNRVDVVVPMESIRAISERFDNTAYGLFWESRWPTPLLLTMLGTLGDKLHGFPVTAFSEDGLSSIATKLGTPFMLDSYTYDMCIQSWGRSSYAKALIEVQANVELKNNIVVAIPKLVGDGFYTYECPKNKDSDVVKNMKKPSQTPKGVSVGPKLGFKPVKQVFRQVFKKNNVNTTCNKKKNVEPTIEVSNSNPSDVLNSVENDVDLGTNGGTSNLASKRLILVFLVTLVDDEGNPLTKVDYSGDHDIEDEVASVDNDMANFLDSKKDGYGTNSMWEEWKESYANGNYDFDPNDDDMFKV
ncbi:hypothetical protein Tco_1459037 [Tanacetum coccineum]